jgi:hypothetical protein
MWFGTSSTDGFAFRRGQKNISKRKIDDLSCSILTVVLAVSSLHIELLVLLNSNIFEEE